MNTRRQTYILDETLKEFSIILTFLLLNKVTFTLPVRNSGQDETTYMYILFIPILVVLRISSLLLDLTIRKSRFYEELLVYIQCLSKIKNFVVPESSVLLNLCTNKRNIICSYTYTPVYVCLCVYPYI